MDLQDLTDVHTRRHTQRIQYDIQRTAIWQERHIFNRKDTGNHTLVTMTTGHLVTYRDLSLLCNVNSYGLIYTRCQLVTIFSCEDFCIYDNTIFTMRYFQGSITYFTCFFSEDCTQQTLFCCQLCLALRCYFSDQNITGTHFCTDTDDTTLIQIFQCFITDTRNVTCDLFRSQFGITCFCFVFLDMDRCVYIVHNQSLTQQNGILVVVTFPGHESDQRVLTKSDFAVGCGRTVCDNLSGSNSVALENDRTLIVAVTLVAS